MSVTSSPGPNIFTFRCNYQEGCDKQRNISAWELNDAELDLIYIHGWDVYLGTTSDRPNRHSCPYHSVYETHQRKQG